MIGTTPTFVVATAVIDDGGVAAYPLRFTLEHGGGRWAVSSVEVGSTPPDVGRHAPARCAGLTDRCEPASRCCAGGAAVLTVVIGHSCSGGGAGDPPSPVAVRDVPQARMLAIYQQVGAHYKLPVGDPRRDRQGGVRPRPPPRPLLHPAAGSQGPRRRERRRRRRTDAGRDRRRRRRLNTLRSPSPTRRSGRHDPTTAVKLTAFVLIKDKGAPTGQPIDAYLDYARAYNGAGPLADAYAARVLADAHAYQGAGTITVGGASVRRFRDADRAGHRERGSSATVAQAAAAADAPAAVQAMIVAGNRINHFPYSYGGARRPRPDDEPGQPRLGGGARCGGERRSRI